MADVYDEFLEMEAQSGATQISMGDLTPNKAYVICAVEVTRHPDIGRGVRASIENNTRYVFFTGRFRQLTDTQIATINSDVAAGRPPALLYLGPDGRPQRMAIRRFGRKYFSIDPKNRNITLGYKFLFLKKFLIKISVLHEKMSTGI